MKITSVRDRRFTLYSAPRGDRAPQGGWGLGNLALDYPKSHTPGTKAPGGFVTVAWIDLFNGTGATRDCRVEVRDENNALVKAFPPETGVTNGTTVSFTNTFLVPSTKPGGSYIWIVAFQDKAPSDSIYGDVSVHSFTLKVSGWGLGTLTIT